MDNLPMPRKSIKQILADNVNALIEERRNGAGSNPVLAKRANLGTGTISRVRNATQDATIETVERIANVYGLHAIDLLVPHQGRVVSLAHAPAAGDADPAKYDVKSRVSGLTAEERRLLDLFQATLPEQRKPLLDMVAASAEMARQLRSSGTSPLAKSATQ